MRKIASAILVTLVSIGAAPTHAQSVAEALTTLTNRLNSPLVLTRSETTGGQLYVMDSSQKQTTVQLRTDKSGGNIDLYDLSGGKSVYIGTRSSDSSGEIRLYFPRDKTSVALTHLGFFVLDSTGTDRLAYLAKTTDGTAILSLNDPNKGQTRLNASGLFVLDSGKKQLASFSKTADGRSAVVYVNGTQVHDYAEVFDLTVPSGLIPGSVVAVSSDGNGLRLSSTDYDPAVVGVISGAGAFQPGMRIGSRGDGSSNLPVAVSGQVYVRVNAEAGPIAVGDLLVSSSVAGIAMRGVDKTRLTGTVIGKALQPYWGEGESLIRMLVMVR